MITALYLITFAAVLLLSIKRIKDKEYQGDLHESEFQQLVFDFFNSELKCLADENGIYSVFGKYFEISGITKSDGIKSPLEI